MPCRVLVAPAAEGSFGSGQPDTAADAAFAGQGPTRALLLWGGALPQRARGRGDAGAACRGGSIRPLLGRTLCV